LLRGFITYKAAICWELLICFHLSV